MGMPRTLANLILLAEIFGLVNAQECAADGQCSSRHSSVCEQSSSASLYRHGGSARAYTSQVPESTMICEESYLDLSHRVATWPFSRSSLHNAPQIAIETTLWGCKKSPSSQCTCEPIEDKEGTTIEVWQASPGGTYSPVSSDTGECRAKLSGYSKIEFETVAPGSTGSLGGLGPSNWDFFPYGPPLIHFLAQSPGHLPTLVDVPMSFDPQTLELVNFRWPDWRGSARVGSHSPTSSAFKLSHISANRRKKTVKLSLDLYLYRSDDDIPVGFLNFCEASASILPASFFKEPITECSSLQRFFDM